MSIGEKMAYHQPKKHKNKHGIEIKLNFTYKLEDGRIGSCKYLGKTGFAKGYWVGLELADGFKGKNNGSMGGETYFRISSKRKNAGVFVKVDKIVKKLPGKLGKYGGKAKHKDGAIDTGKNEKWKQTKY